MLKVRELTRIKREGSRKEKLEEDFDCNDRNFLFMIKDVMFRILYVYVENILKIMLKVKDAHTHTHTHIYAKFPYYSL
jgi:hypothetical protein